MPIRFKNLAVRINKLLTAPVDKVWIRKIILLINKNKKNFRILSPNLIPNFNSFSPSNQQLSNHIINNSTGLITIIKYINY